MENPRRTSPRAREIDGFSPSAHEEPAALQALVFNGAGFSVGAVFIAVAAVVNAALARLAASEGDFDGYSLKRITVIYRRSSGWILVARARRPPRRRAAVEAR